MTYEPKEVGKRIKEARLAKGLKTDELAAMLQLSEATLYRYESGSIGRIKTPVLESIGDILEVTTDWLIGRTDKIGMVEEIPYTFYPFLRQPFDQKLTSDISDYIDLPKVALPDVLLGAYARNPNLVLFSCTNPLMEVFMGTPGTAAVIIGVTEQSLRTNDQVLLTVNGELAPYQYFSNQTRTVYRPMVNNINFTDVIVENGYSETDYELICKVISFQVVL